MKIIEKLQKLIAHQESAVAIGNEAEAAAFALKIQQLLNRHNLSMSEVEIHAAENEAVDIEPAQELPSEIESWQILLLNNLAEMNGCHGLKHGSGTFLIVVGRKQDREITISLYQYFEKLGQELAEKFLNPQPRLSDDFNIFWATDFSFCSKSTRRSSYLLGYVTAVCDRLRSSLRRAKQESNNSTALVFLNNKKQDNQQFIDRNLNVEKDEVPKEDIDNSALMRGFNAGNQVALTSKVIE